MKVKVRNVLILLLGILVFGTILCSNQVKATEITKEQAQAMLDLIPNEIALDIPEVDCEEKADKLIEAKVKDILKNKNISTEGISRLQVHGPKIYLLDIYTATISIDGVHKEVSVSYNNTNQKNKADEQYVKGLKIESPKYFGMDVELFDFSKTFEQTYGEMFKAMGNYYTDLINDDSIVVVADSGAGGGSAFSTGTAEKGTTIGIFKNGVLYDIRIMGCESMIPIIDVPANIKEDEISNFLISEINKYWPELVNYIHHIEKGAKSYDGIEVKNGYSIYFSKDYLDEEFYDILIVNREEPNNINSQDNKTNIKLETDTSVVPENTTLVVEKITTGDSYNTVVATLGDTIDKFVLYDITLKSNGVEIQPNGKVKISIPIPEGFSKDKLVVYRISDNEKIKYDVKVETVGGKDYATFETDHFSLYTLALDNGTTNNESKELDETPKTGNVDISLYAFTAIAIILLAGIIIAKKNNK